MILAQEQMRIPAPRLRFRHCLGCSEGTRSWTLKTSIPGLITWVEESIRRGVGMLMFDTLILRPCLVEDAPGVGRTCDEQIWRFSFPLPFLTFGQLVPCAVTDPDRLKQP